MVKLKNLLLIAAVLVPYTAVIVYITVTTVRALGN